MCWRKRTTQLTRNENCGILYPEFSIQYSKQDMSRQLSFSQIERSPTLDEGAYLQIKEAILSGMLMPGQPVVESQLAEKLGISRTPIRKAIWRLEQESFITATPFKGYHVSRIESQDIKEIYQLREILECHLVRATVEQFTDKDFADIEYALRVADEALERGDYIAFLESNRKFHHIFDRKFGNRRISDVLINLDEHVRWILATEVHDRQDIVLASFQEHRLIFEAVQKRDVESAVSLMRQHLAGICLAIIQGRERPKT